MMFQNSEFFDTLFNYFINIQIHLEISMNNRVTIIVLQA